MPVSLDSTRSLRAPLLRIFPSYMKKDGKF